jgi:hypothetical protein
MYHDQFPYRPWVGQVCGRIANARHGVLLQVLPLEAIHLLHRLSSASHSDAGGSLLEFRVSLTEAVPSKSIPALAERGIGAE